MSRKEVRGKICKVIQPGLTWIESPDKRDFCGILKPLATAFEVRESAP